MISSSECNRYGIRSLPYQRPHSSGSAAARCFSPDAPCPDRPLREWISEIVQTAGHEYNHTTVRWAGSAHGADNLREDMKTEEEAVARRCLNLSWVTLELSDRALGHRGRSVEKEHEVRQLQLCNRSGCILGTLQ